MGFFDLAVDILQTLVIKEKPYIEQIHVKAIKVDILSFLKSIKYPKSIRIKNGQIMDLDKLNELDTISYI